NGRRDERDDTPAFRGRDCAHRSAAGNRLSSPAMSILYVSDLDGTLLAGSGRLSEYSRTTLRELLAEGLPFSVASARSVASIRTVLAGVPLALPVVELNGALISDLCTGRHEVVNAIEPEIAEDIYRLFVQLGHAPFIATFDGAADCLYYPAVTNEGMQWYVSDIGGSAGPPRAMSYRPRGRASGARHLHDRDRASRAARRARAAAPRAIRHDDRSAPLRKSLFPRLALAHRPRQTRYQGARNPHARRDVRAESGGAGRVRRRGERHQDLRDRGACRGSRE